MKLRQIKFRGKRTDTGEMVFGDLIHGVGSKHGRMYILPVRNIYPKGCNDLDGWEVIPDTIGQFTGLLDTNGKDIYEGDILGFTTKREMGYQKDDMKIALSVVFGRCNPDNDTLSEYMGFWVERKGGYRGSISYEVGSHGAKVIGNIHDNPELLKGGKE